MPEKKRVRLLRPAADFAATAGGASDDAAGQTTVARWAIGAGRAPRIKRLDYDWELNDKDNRPRAES